MAQSTKNPPFCKCLFATIPLFFAAPAHAQTPLENLPNSPRLAPFSWFASTDPKRQNDDFFLLKPGETRRVPLAAGQLERLWSTAQFPDQIDLTLQSNKNRRELLWSGGKARRGLFSEKAFTFFPSLRRDPLGLLDKNAMLIATNRAKEPSKWYFQAAVRPIRALPAPQMGRTATRRLFKMQLAPGEEKEVENFAKPGQIFEFSVAVDVPGAATFRKLRLKADFDGEKAVDVPLMSLAGQIEGDELVQNAVADFDGSRLVLRWPMPFNSAKISLHNGGDKPLQLDVGARLSSFSTAPTPYRFCALQFQKTPTKDRPVEILNVQGAGSLVGMALDLTPSAESARRQFAYLEGNEIIVADGQKFEGTGTEDFFSSAWYYPAKPFFLPFEGMSRKALDPPSVSAYRFLIPDAIPFQKTLRFDFEHGSGNKAEDVNWNYAVMWYQKSPLNLPNVTDSPSPGASQATAPVAPDQRWKIGAAIGLGVLLGVASALSKRKRRT